MVPIRHTFAIVPSEDELPAALLGQMRRGLSILVAASLVGCHHATTASERAPFSITAQTPTQIFAAPGSQTPENPTVVVRDRSNSPIAGVVVKFTPSSGSTVALTSAMTDAHGVASCGAWTLAPQEGQNSVVAYVAGVGSVTFVATGGELAPLYERYDLLTISGQPLPITYSAGSQSWTIAEGHYVFAVDGTFKYWSVFLLGDPARRDSNIVNGRYTRVSATRVMIYFPDPIGTATIQDDRLSIEYDRYPDWEPEVYVRAR